MQFKKYTSIENSYRQKTIEAIKQCFPNDEFVVTEKIHGSNLSFTTDGKDVKCCSRNSLLTEEDSFFGYQKVLKRHKEDVIKIFKHIEKSISFTHDLKLHSINLFGELCGGSYPHPDVKPVDVKRIQKGVYYSPDVEFVAFDIFYTSEDKSGNIVSGWYLLCDVIELCETYGISCVQPLFTGTLDECLKYPNDYQTTIPQLYGLPEIEGNICEGNVIRPSIESKLPNGSRVLLKNKNEKFSEKQKVSTNKKPKEPVPEHILNLQEKSLEYITENRLENVLSKIDSLTEKEFGKLMGLFSQDVVGDFSKEHEEYDQLDNKEKKLVSKFINKECANLIRKDFVNILDRYSDE